MRTKFLTCLALGLLLAAPFTVRADQEEDDGPTSFELTYPYPMGDDDLYFQKGNSIKQLPNGNLLIAGMGSPEDNDSYTGLLLELDQNGDEVWFSPFLEADGRYTSELFSADQSKDGKFFMAIGDSERLPLDLTKTEIYKSEEEEEEEEDGAQTTHQDDEEEEVRTSAIFAKYRKDGDLSWAKVTGDRIESHTFIGRSITINENGDAVFVASTAPLYRSLFGKMSPNGELKWGKEVRIQLQEVIPLEDGYLLTGVGRYGSSHCIGDIWNRCGARLVYIKISEDGEEQWGRVWGINMSELQHELEGETASSRRLSETDSDEEEAQKEEEQEQAKQEEDQDNSQLPEEEEQVEEKVITEIYHARVAQTKDGGFIFTGSTSYKHSLFALKVDSDGTEQWSKFYSNGAEVSEGLGIAETSDGGYIITGTTNGQVDANNHFDFAREFSKMLLVKIDSEGEIQWAKSYADDEQVINEGRSVIEDKNGYFWVTGFSSERLHYSEVKLNNLDPFEKNYNYVNPRLVILKVEPNGDMDLARSEMVDIEFESHDRTFSAMTFVVDFTHIEVELSDRYVKNKDESDSFLGEDFTLFNVLLMGGVIIAFLILIIWGVCLRMGKKSEETQPLNDGVELSNKV